MFREFSMNIILSTDLYSMPLVSSKPNNFLSFYKGRKQFVFTAVRVEKLLNVWSIKQSPESGVVLE